MAIARGNVDIRNQDMRLTADKVTFWIEKDEMLAEGNVIFHKQREEIKGESIKYNFREKKGELVNADTYYAPWFAEGKKIERIGENEVKIYGGDITTCDREKPHYRFTAKRIDFYLDSKKLVAHHCFFLVGKVPVFYIPYYRRKFDDKRSRLTIVPGKSSDWGAYVLGGYNFDLTKVIYGTAHLDWRDKKGWAEGIDLKYHPANRSGFWKTYYINEKDKDTGEKKDRWRAEVIHREQIKKNIVGTLEFHRMSDIDFRKDYFYDDYVKDIQPETYISLTGTYPNWMWNFLAKKRVNDFYTETERLPEVQFNFQKQQIGETPFYYKGHLYASYLDKKIAGADSAGDTVRVDTYDQISYPVKLYHWLSLDPYLGVRETWYSKDIDGDAVWRGIFYSGVEASTKFYRIYEVESEALEIDRLRHVIIPRVRYEYRKKPSVTPDELIEFDSIDTLDNFNFVHLEIDSRLQTKRMIDGRIMNVDLATLRLESGFHVKKPSDEKRWANVRAKLELRPKDWLGFNLDSYIDPYNTSLEMVNTDFSLYGKDDIWTFTLGNRYNEDENNELYSGLKWQITPKWAFDVYGRYDFDDSEFAEQRYRIDRDLHCWMSSFSYVKKRDETELWLMLWIKAFPEMPLSFSHALGEDS